MTAPHYARVAGKVLGAATASPPPSPDQRALAILAMQNAVVAREAQRQRRRRLLWLASAAAVAASVGMVARVVHTRQMRSQALAASPSPSATPASSDITVVAHALAGDESVVVQRPLAPLDGGWTLKPTSRVVTTRTGRAALAFSTGTRVEVEEASDVTVDRAGAYQELRLDSGAIDLHVAALNAAQRFVVHTSDADVEVRGTRFRVAVVPVDAACGGGTVTRVSVQEGLVVVRHASSESRVGVGEEWPADCVPAAFAAPSVPASLSPTSLHAVGRTPAVSVPLSALGEQNDLFSQALAAKRRGDFGGAVARLDELLTHFPSSPLVESAEIERMRVLRTTDPSAAREAAKRYLARFPRGLGRAQADAILAEAR